MTRVIFMTGNVKEETVQSGISNGLTGLQAEQIADATETALLRERVLINHGVKSGLTHDSA
ncbi:MAG: hypothetical protein IJ242_16405 [Clostridia bacterium]|nr:hypothetical protein [Clostridia bacterium]